MHGGAGLLYWLHTVSREQARADPPLGSEDPEDPWEPEGRMNLLGFVGRQPGLGSQLQASLKAFPRGPLLRPLRMSLGRPGKVRVKPHPVTKWLWCHREPDANPSVASPGMGNPAPRTDDREHEHLGESRLRPSAVSAAQEGPCFLYINT